jgi:hypothetical protein
MDNNFLLIIILIGFLYILFRNKISNENFAVVYDGDNMLAPISPKFVNSKEECNPEIYDIEEYLMKDDDGNPILDENGAASVSGYLCSMKNDKCPYVTKYNNTLVCNDNKHYFMVPPKKQKKNRDDLCKSINKNYINIEQRYNSVKKIWEPVGKTKAYCVTTLNLKK